MRIGATARRKISTLARPRVATIVGISALTLAMLATGCAARVVRLSRVPRHAVTLFNGMQRIQFCHVRMQPATGGAWTQLSLVDPMSTGVYRTLRIPDGRWRFRFERCGPSGAIVTPPLEVAMTRVVLMLCDDACAPYEGPGQATTVRFNPRRGTVRITEPEDVPSGGRPMRLIL